MHSLVAVPWQGSWIILKERLRLTITQESERAAVWDSNMWSIGVLEIASQILSLVMLKSVSGSLTKAQKEPPLLRFWIPQPVSHSAWSKF